MPSCCSSRSKINGLIQRTDNILVEKVGAPTLPPCFPCKPSFYFDTLNELLYVWVVSSQTWVLYPIPDPDIFLVLSGNQNVQMFGFGTPTLQKAFFGTVSLLPDTPPLLPAFDIFINQGGFIEDTTYSQSGPPGVRGAPGWRVPMDGTYKISACCPVAAQVAAGNPPASQNVGMGSPFFVTLQYAINNGGFLGQNISNAAQFWSSTPVENYIAHSLNGFVYVQLLTTDVLFVGVSTNNTNMGIQLENSTLEIRFIQ